MPFTFSHPAAVLPLLPLPKRWRSMTGLIIGSMAPDFEKFITMSEHDPHSHSWQGLFYFNLPLGLMLAFVFHLVVRDDFIAHLPRFLRVRLSRFTGFDWRTYFRKNYGVIIFSILVGAVSHLGWDSFTHEDGRGVRLFPILKSEVLGGVLGMKVYSLLQKITSVAGALATAAYLLQLPRGKELPMSRQHMIQFWALVAAVSVAVVGIRSQIGQGIELGSLYHLSIVGISAGLTSLVLSPVLLKLRHSF
ncbi:DUF4184 family protein [Rufibacter immobilis]|uniref:DUF4184 family protein n=1 Tax=Rufibacter immobilis TaxID=1348778 RepID=A0A3M9MZB8_9BACT|nr:DUF4184 family protein [Rufibacter immobilis]RNI30840.1 DUF4184 family protein [Rufibacter immobilis]